MTDDVPRVSDPALLPIREKVLAGAWLDASDGDALYATRDVYGVGRLAHHVRTALHGDVAFYNRNRHVNYTNVCALSCKFCSFYRKRGEAGAYEMPAEQVIATAVKAAETGATEVHIVGGLHPWLKFDYYLGVLRGIRAAAPSLHIKAFTAIEIVHFSRISGLSIAGTLAALKDAGLGSLPGGGAEIFDDRVHDAAFKGKVREDKWFEVHRTAHGLGLFTNATMLYGHIEGTAERVRHMIKLRDVQAQSLAGNRRRVLQLHHPAQLHPRRQRARQLARPDRTDRPEDARDHAADDPERRAREGVLDHAVDAARAALAVVGRR